MESARAALQRSMKRLDVAYRRAGSNFMLYVLLFGLALFMAVYALAKVYRLGRRVVGAG